MKNKEHLTHEGLLKILSLKSALNKGLSKNTSEIENIEILESYKTMNTIIVIIYNYILNIKKSKYIYISKH